MPPFAVTGAEHGFSTPPWGVVENSSGYGAPSMPAQAVTDYTTRVRRMRDEAGATWIRLDIPWTNGGGTTGGRGPEMDLMVNTAHAYGYKVIAILVDWAGSGSCYGAVGSEEAALDGVINGILNRYNSGGVQKIHAFQFGNEIGGSGELDPNFAGTYTDATGTHPVQPSGRPPNRGDAVRYAAIMNHVFQTVRNHQYGANVHVLTGSLCAKGTDDSFGKTPTTWMSAFIPAVATGLVNGVIPFDGLTSQPYSGGKIDSNHGPLFDTSGNGGVSINTMMRNKLVAQFGATLADLVKIWSTEVGFYAPMPGTDYGGTGSHASGTWVEHYSANVVTFFKQLLDFHRQYSWCGPLLVYTWDGPLYDAGTTHVSDMGAAGVVDYNSGGTSATNAAQRPSGAAQTIAALLLSYSSGGGGSTSLTGKGFVVGYSYVGGGDLVGDSLANVVTASAVLSGTGALSGTTRRTATVGALLSGSGGVAATAKRSVLAAATLTGAGDANASVGRVVQVAVAFSGTGDASATTSRTVVVAATLVGHGGVIVSQPGMLVTASVTLTGAGVLNVAARITKYAAVRLSGTGSASATGTRILSGGARLSGAGAIVAAALRIAQASASLTGTSSGQGAASVQVPAQATLTGAGVLQASGDTRRVIEAQLHGSGQLSAQATVGLATAATLRATGQLHANAAVARDVRVVLSGLGSLRVDAQVATSVDTPEADMVIVPAYEVVTLLMPAYDTSRSVGS